jgi:transcriptional regulator with XRE-family HTH domain
LVLRLRATLSGGEVPDRTKVVFAQVMRHFREAEGLSVRALAKAANVHPSRISRAENGHTLMSLSSVRAIDQALHAGGVLEVLRQGATQNATLSLPPGDISSILERMSASNNGEYADGTITVSIDIAGKVVHVQLSRRTLLGVLAAGGAGVMPAAPAQAATAASVWPRDEDPIVYATRFLVGHQDAHHLFTPAVHIDALRRRLDGIEQIRQGCDAATRRRLRAVQGTYAEHLSWLSKEVGDLEGCTAWAERAALWALEVADHAMVTYMQLRKASLALDRRDHQTAVELAEQAVNPSWRIPDVLKGIGHAYLARGRALAGGHPDADMERANDLLNTVRSEETPNYLRFYGSSFADAETATAYLEAGRPEEAIDLLGRCIGRIAVTHRRDKASYLARLANAHCAAQAPDAAAEAASEALVIATEAGSQSVRTELVRLDAILMSRWPDQRRACEFHELIAAA